MRELYQFVGVEDFVVGDGKRALIASPPENFCQAVQQRVALFFAAGHCTLRHGGNLGDLAGELLIEKLPSLMASQLGRHQAAAGTVLTLYSDDSKHHSPPPPRCSK